MNVHFVCDILWSMRIVHIRKDRVPWVKCLIELLVRIEMISTLIEQIREWKNIVVVMPIARVCIDPRVIKILKLVREAHVRPQSVKYGMKRPKERVICRCPGCL